jgi:hypothetical protein
MSKLPISLAFLSLTFIGAVIASQLDFKLVNYTIVANKDYVDLLVNVSPDGRKFELSGVMKKINYLMVSVFVVKLSSYH